MGAEKIEWTTAELATIEFRPGDVAVLMFPHKLDRETLQGIRAIWEKLQPGIKCLVLEEGARIGVLREAAND